jgi:hypothetical protein
MYPRLPSNSQFFCLSLHSVRIAGMHHHAWLQWYAISILRLFCLFLCIMVQCLVCRHKAELWFESLSPVSWIYFFCCAILSLKRNWHDYSSSCAPLSSTTYIPGPWQEVCTVQGLFSFLPWTQAWVLPVLELGASQGKKHGHQWCPVTWDGACRRNDLYFNSDTSSFIYIRKYISSSIRCMASRRWLGQG